MVNRLLLRVKAVQTLYSFFVSGGMDGKKIERELLDNIKSSGDIYYYLMQMPVEMSRYLQQAEVHSHSEDDPEANPIYKIMSCRKFRENRLAKLLEVNQELATELAEREMSETWRFHRDVLKDIAIAVSEKEYFDQYAASEESSLKEDVELWCQILENDVQASERMEEMMEEMDIYWNDDLANAVAFVIKSIKRLKAEKGAEQPLMPLIKDVNELEYAKRLVRYVIMHYEEADQCVQPLLKGWSLERVSVMDLTILRAAYAELKTCTDIHAGVIINEYIEIAKRYCDDKAVPFISGVLYPLAKEIRPFEVKGEK